MISFTKMHGIGNDYIYINCLENELENPEEFSKWVSNEHFGIGADGLVLICPSQTADFKMRIFNADGSEAKMCGNASRCVGKYVYEKGLTNKTSIRLETLSGIKILNLTLSGDRVTDVTVDMGKAVLKPREIPINADGEHYIAQEIEVGGKSYQVTCVSMGNPHAVVFVPDTKSLDLEKIGPLFEHHPLFPDRVNTEFIQLIDGHTLKMRVWERGSGETWACGTGACASVVAAVLNGFCGHDEEVLVHLRGGDLKITYQKDGTVIKKGSATFICDGTLYDEERRI